MKMTRLRCKVRNTIIRNASCSMVQQIESCQSLSAIHNRSLLLAAEAQRSAHIYNYRLYEGKIDHRF